MQEQFHIQLISWYISVPVSSPLFFISVPVISAAKKLQLKPQVPNYTLANFKLEQES